MATNRINFRGRSSDDGKLCKEDLKKEEADQQGPPLSNAASLKPRRKKQGLMEAVWRIAGE